MPQGVRASQACALPLAKNVFYPHPSLFFTHIAILPHDRPEGGDPSPVPTLLRPLSREAGDEDLITFIGRCGCACVARFLLSSVLCAYGLIHVASIVRHMIRPLFLSAIRFYQNPIFRRTKAAEARSGTASLSVRHLLLLQHTSHFRFCILCWASRRSLTSASKTL